MSNQYLGELLRLMQNRYEIDRDTMGYADWICANTSLRNRKFSFDKYPMQKQIADDMHPMLSCIKISQVGLTEVQIRKALAFLKRNQGTTLIFTFPDDAMRKRNSQQRISPIVEGDKVFNLNNDINKPTRSIELYQIAQSFLNVVGNKESDATSTSADVIFQDEVDLSDQAMLALFGSRVQGSDWKIIQKFSTPTYSGFGIDADFNLSDQKHYLVKCDCCNHWQFPVFEPQFINIPNLSSDISNLLEIDQGMIDNSNLDLLNAEVVCEKCRAPLDLGRADNRSWVAKYPSRTHHHGYRINPFTVSTLNVAYIVTQLLKYKQANFIRGFKNTVLGLADDAANNRLNLAQINTAFTNKMVIETIDKTLPTWVGIDVGQTCHITIGQGYTLNQIEAVKFMTCHVDELLNVVGILKNTLNITGGLIDRHPYEPTADAVREVTHGLILPCEYRGDKELNMVLGPAKEELYVQANRTALLDEVRNGITSGKLMLSGYGDFKAIITDHLRNMVREETPEKPAVWVKLSQDDHFFHSTGFMLSAVKLRRLQEFKTVNPQTYIGVAGSDLVGYNDDIFGQTKKSRTAWQRIL